MQTETRFVTRPPEPPEGNGLLKQIAQANPAVYEHDPDNGWLKHEGGVVAAWDEQSGKIIDAGFIERAWDELCAAGVRPNPIGGKRSTVIQDFAGVERKRHDPNAPKPIRFKGRNLAEAVAQIYLDFLQRGGTE